jgi:hypothetical protein
MSIISNPVTGPVTGQPIHPNFSQQFAGGAPANNLTSIPAGMTQLEAASRAIIPININLAAVNGISTSVGNSDPCSMLEAMTNGNGLPTCRGTSAAPSGAINDEQFVVGTSAQTFQANGPTPTNTEPQPLGPVSAAITGANLTLIPNSYNG